jgi:Lrp/AsnC family leucine-responsive transcriptional regulator
MIDSFDKQLLTLLQRNAKASTKELADMANLSVSPCWRRIKRLEEIGVIEKYAVLLNPKQLGLNAMAYVHVSLMDHTKDTIDKFDCLVQSLDQVIDCCSITGESDYVLKVVARDPEDLESFIMKQILGPGLVRSSMTNFVLRSTKSNSALPVNHV